MKTRTSYFLFLLPLVGAALVYRAGYTPYTLLLYLCFAFSFFVILLIVARGHLRDAALTVASILLCLVALEAFEVVANPRSLAQQGEGFAGSRPILGWGAIAPGSFPAKKVDPHSGKIIYDTRYTIDDQLLRKTVSAEIGPTVAFFGDSFMFGEGLPDRETLPQAFSDLEDHKFRVLNFGFSGYGPQQFLRAVETRMYDARLQNARLFVFETAPWHAERTACTPSFVLRAPRYVLKNGQVTYAGACAEGVTKFLREMLGNSAAFRTLVQPAEGAPGAADIDLYIAVVLRAVALAREIYHVPTLVLYLPFTDSYLKKSGYTDQEIMQKLRKGGAEVIDGSIDLAAYPGVDLYIPGDGHPAGAANRVYADKIKAWWVAHETTPITSNSSENANRSSTRP